MLAIIPDESMIPDMDLLHAADSDWSVVLFQNDLTPDTGTVWGDLVEADFSGYGRAAAVWSSPELIDDYVRENTDTITFMHDGGGTDNDVYGVALVDFGPATPIIKAIGRFDAAPILMNPSSPALNITVFDFYERGTLP